ncbi:MAG: hypothetical protein V4635_17875 [Bacteroidota bacterium]
MTVHSYSIQLTMLFLDKLRKDRQDFVVGLDTYIQAIKVVNDFFDKSDSEDLEMLGKSLAPVICRTAEQQAEFHSLFYKEVVKPNNEYISDTLAEIRKTEAAISILETNIQKRQKLRKNGRLIALLVLLMLISIPTRRFIYKEFVYRPEPNYTVITHVRDPFYKEGEPLKIDFSTLFENSEDSSEFKLSAYLKRSGDTITSFGKRLFVKKAGRDCLLVHLSSDKYNIDKYVTNDSIYTAPGLKGEIDLDEETVAGIENTYHFNEKDSLGLPFTWFINDSTNALWDNAHDIKFTFSQPGINTIRIQYDNGRNSFFSKFSPDYFSISKDQEVLADETLPIDFSEREVQREHEHHVNVLWFLAMLFTLLGCLILIYFNRRKFHALKQQLRMTSPVRIPSTSGVGLPLEVPFNSGENKITASNRIEKLAAELKKTTESPVKTIDFKETIRQTAKNKGFVTPVLKNKQSAVYYLFLVDFAYANSLQFQLFSFLIRFFIRKRVNIDFYFYYQNPDLFYQKENEQGLSLSQLSDVYYNARLFVVSTGYSFMDFRHPGVKADYKKKFEYWPVRTLITPIPFNDWGSTERELARVFKMVPADIVGLIEIVNLLGENQKPAHLHQRNFSTYHAKSVDFHTTEALSAYLGDEDLLQWLCALAVYPKINWSLTIEIGVSVLGNNSFKVNYENLLKLARIKWMHEGEFTSSLRLMLLKNLKVENELKARATVLKLLDDINLDETMFSYEEKLVNKCTNSFILRASGDQYKQIYQAIYENSAELEKYAELFTDLFRAGKFMDHSLVSYLGNAAGWETPIMFGDKNVGIDEYYKLQDEAKEAVQKEKERQGSRYLKRNLIRFAVIATIIIVSGICLDTFKHKIVRYRANDLLALIDHRAAEIDTAYIDNMDECQGNLPRLEVKSIKITAPDGQVYRSENVTELLAIPVSKKGTLLEYVLEMRGKKSTKIFTALPGKRYKLMLGGKSCKSIEPPVYVQYGSVVQYSLVNFIKGQLEDYNYNVSQPQQMSFSGGNSVRYNRPEMETDAKKLQEFMNAVLKTREKNKFDLILNLQNGFPERNLNGLEVWINDVGDEPPSRLKDTVEIYYCQQINKDKAESFARLISSIYVPVIRYYDGICQREIKFFSKKDFKKASDILSMADLFFKTRYVMSESSSSLSTRRNLQVWINFPGRILWLDDHPENNREDIDYFEKNGFEVDLAYTNVEAGNKLNSTVYAFVISDVDRDKDEDGVDDKSQAGVVFAQKVDLMKRYLVIYSSASSLKANLDALKKAGVVNQTYDNKFLRSYIMDNASVGNTFPSFQFFSFHNMKSCTSKKTDNGYVFYFGEDKTTLDATSLELLDEMASSLVKNQSTLSPMRCLHYSGRSKEYNTKIADKYGQYIVNYLKGKGVNMTQFKYTTESEAGLCANRVEVFIREEQTPSENENQTQKFVEEGQEQIRFGKDTQTLDTLSGFVRVRERSVQIERNALKKYGISLSIESVIYDYANFKFETSRENCLKGSFSVGVDDRTYSKENICDINLKIKVTSGKGAGAIYYNIIVEKSLSPGK